MKCIYYLSPTLASAEAIVDDLHHTGVNDWFMHIICKDEAGLSRRQLHSSNYLETLDLLRDGLVGAGTGLLGGLLLAWLASVVEPFGAPLPMIAYLAMIFLVTCFGAWVGGLVGIMTENKKLLHFHDAIEAGHYLILVYADKRQEQQVQDMMGRLHPEARLVGQDGQFWNPFSQLVLLDGAERGVRMA